MYAEFRFSYAKIGCNRNAMKMCFGDHARTWIGRSPEAEPGLALRRDDFLTSKAVAHASSRPLEYSLKGFSFNALLY
jgi:hypothetical protein